MRKMFSGDAELKYRSDYEEEMLANVGYAVAAVDYEWVPEISYPEQLRQVQEFIKELKKRRAEGLPVDINRVYLAGDSAGAHIAAQCALCATNPDFKKDGKELAEKLKSLGVMTSELFFNESEGEIGHIYQYDLSSKAGYVCYQKTLEFLKLVEADATKEE